MGGGTIIINTMQHVRSGPYRMRYPTQIARHNTCQRARRNGVAPFRQHAQQAPSGARGFLKHERGLYVPISRCEKLVDTYGGEIPHAVPTQAFFGPGSLLWCAVLAAASAASGSAAEGKRPLQPSSRKGNISSCLALCR